MKSILFSLWMTAYRLDWRDAIVEIWRGGRGILRALRFRRSDLSLLRDVHCKNCEFFDAKWRTCGTPGEVIGEQLGFRLKVGCWCYLPLANRDPAKDCYARANGLDVGWPDGLRPKKTIKIK